MTPRLSAAFDAARISDRQATHILMAAAEGFGVDAKDYVINRTSIKGYREKLREIKAKEIKDNFGGHELNAAVIHWDGKLLQAVTGKEMVDRLPIIITNGDSEQILAVPFLESGTGAFTAGAVYETLCEWGLRDIVKACCFDTTAVNTGKDNGSCILLEKKLERHLLNLACRHHIFELVIKAAFESKIPGTSGPDVLLFKRFQG